jgi:FkbM family methyltransferase
MKNVLKKFAFWPMRMAARYSKLLGQLRIDWGHSWNDTVYLAVSSQVTEVTHMGGRSPVVMRFYTPNSVCRFRAATFSTKEPETLEWIDEFGSEGAFFDVGANIGLYSVYYAKTHSGKVYAFEPSVLNLGLLAKNLKENGISDRVIIIPNPLTARNQISDLHMSSLDEGGALSTFGEQFGHSGHPIQEQMHFQTTGYSLDFLMETKIVAEIPALMKIDVDGIEHLILQGAMNLLENQTLRTILIEVNDDFVELARDVRDSLLAAGFVLSKKRQSEMFKGGSFSHSFNQIWVRPNL